MRGKFTVCVTHDVDSLRYKRRYRLRGALAARSFEPLRPSFSPCRAFDECIALERSFGAKSTFFFLDYDERSLRAVAGAGCEVALHAEARTIEDFESLSRAKARLEEALGTSVYGLRQHKYPSTKMNLDCAWANAKRAGLNYDSSVGAKKEKAFSHEQPSEPLAGFVELPVNVIDSSLIYYLRLSPKAALAETKRAIDEVARKRGVFVFLTHLNNVFDDYNLPGWRDYYSAVLLYCKNKGARFLTCRKAAAAFR